MDTFELRKKEELDKVCELWRNDDWKLIFASDFVMFRVIRNEMKYYNLIFLRFFIYHVCPLQLLMYIVLFFIFWL